MQRHQRLEEDIKIAVSDIILRDVKHPNINGIISVTRVELTPDQKYAKIFISIFNVDDKTKVLNALIKSVGYIRYELGKKVKLRYLPDLEFKLDDSMEYGAHMDQIIDNLEKKEKSQKEEQQ